MVIFPMTLTPNPVFKVTAHLKSNISKAVHFRDKTARLKNKIAIAQEEKIPNIWNGIMFGTYKCAAQVCRNQLIVTARRVAIARYMLRQRGWLAGWVSVRHMPVLYQNGPNYLKTFSTIW